MRMLAMMLMVMRTVMMLMLMVVTELRQSVEGE